MKYLLILSILLSQASFSLAIYLKLFLPQVHSKVVVFLFYGSYILFIGIYLFIFYRLIKYHFLEEETKLLDKLKDVKQKQKEDIEFSIEEEQKTQEKIVDQLDEIIYELDHNNFEKAKECFMNVYDDFTSHHIQTYCDNAYVNAVMTNKKSLMDKYGINFECQILLPEKMDLDILVLPTILFNILDNAIEASRESYDKMIMLKIHYTESYISIYMKNSSHQAKKEETLGLHGYGISIVEEIVKQNDGTYQWNQDKDQFEAILMLKYKGEKV